MEEVDNYIWLGSGRRDVSKRPRTSQKKKNSVAHTWLNSYQFLKMTKYQKVYIYNIIKKFALTQCLKSWGSEGVKGRITSS